MAEAIRRYMDEELTSDEFIQLLQELRSTTQDTAVLAIEAELSLYFDDLGDGPIVTSQYGWDYLNRVLLLLTSSAEVSVRRVVSWHVGQAVAAFALAVYICLMVRDASVWVWAFAPFGLAVGWFNGRRHAAEMRKVAAVEPFGSFSDLRAVRRIVHNFVRRRYPHHLTARRVRGRFANALTWIVSLPAFVVGSPVMLLFQMLPDVEMRFTTPKMGADTPEPLFR